MNDILSIGSAGLSTYRKTLETISSNIVNANTDGYVRRQAVLKGTGESNMLATAKPNSSGSGVEVESIGRATDIFLQKQMLTATAVNSQAQIVADSLSQLEKTAFSASNDLSASLETFYNSMQDVANAPTALANRYGLINSGQKIADRFNATAKAIENGITSVDSAINASLDSINSLTNQLARLNVSISKNSGSGQKPNDLLDQRDTILQKLSSLVGFTTSEKANGTIDLYIGDTAAGLALVDTKGAHILGTQMDGAQINIVFDPYSSAIPVNSINHGTVAGLLDYRQAANGLMNSINRLAVGLTTALNKQHAEGVDLNGADGSALFSTDGVSIKPSQTNQGSAKVDLTIDSNAKSFGNTYTASYSDKTNLWTIKSNLGASVTGANQLTLDGIHFNISGKPADGDTFFGQPMANAAASMRFLISDPSEIASALPLYVAKNSANLGMSSVTITDRHAITPASTLPKVNDLIAPNLSGKSSFLKDGSAFVIPAGTSKTNLLSLGTVSAVHFLTIGNEIANLNRPSPASGASSFSLSFKLDDQPAPTILSINPKGNSLIDIANAINDAAWQSSNPRLSDYIHASISNGSLDIIGLNNINPDLPAHTITDAVFDTTPKTSGFPIHGINEPPQIPANLQIFTREGVQVSGPRLSQDQITKLINEKNGFLKEAVYSYLEPNQVYPGLQAASSISPVTLTQLTASQWNIAISNDPSYESSEINGSQSVKSGAVYGLDLLDFPPVRLSGDLISGKNGNDVKEILKQAINSQVTKRSVYGSAIDFTKITTSPLKFNVTLNGETSQVSFYRASDADGNPLPNGKFEISGDAKIHINLVPDLSNPNLSAGQIPLHLVVTADDELGTQNQAFNVTPAGSPYSNDITLLGLAPGTALTQLKGAGLIDPKSFSGIKTLQLQIGSSSPYTSATITANSNLRDADNNPILTSSDTNITASWTPDGHVIIQSKNPACLTTSSSTERSDAAAFGFFGTDLSFVPNLEGETGIKIASSLGTLLIDNVSASPGGNRFSLNRPMNEDLIVMTTSDPDLNSLRSIAMQLGDEQIQTKYENNDLTIKILADHKLEIWSKSKDPNVAPIRLAKRTWQLHEPVTYGSLSFVIDGNPSAGDRFDIINDPSRTGDNQNALTIANLTNASLFENAHGSFKDIYTSVASSMGTQISSAKLTAESAKQSMNDLQSAYAAKTGVNLDQEASDLIKFQQAYQASAQIISAARDMFQTLLHSF
ncbi:MAG: flagellar hook-associated protein FlgK [Methylocystaceae bacterium]|nr:flagellar hook-associated protein FlgK [Methylocystaceae bacterium]